MNKIKTSCGRDILLDDEYYDIFKNEEIFLGVNYKYAMIKKAGKLFYVHRLIMKADKGIVIDHINMNTLDNRKCNLRAVNRSQNNTNQNKSTFNKRPTSKYKGVTFDKINKNWICRVFLKNEVIFTGRFKDEISAALAYNFYIKKHYGDFARLNEIDVHGNFDWRKNQLKKRRKLAESKYKYIFWESKQNKWKACVQSKKYGNSKKKSFSNDYEAVLYCNQYIIENKLHLLERKTIQYLKDEDVQFLTEEQLKVYKKQIEITEE